MDFDKLYNKKFLEQQARKAFPKHKKLVAKIKAKKSKQLDYTFLSLHEEAFEQIDCLKCGNCCCGLGPRVLDKDIDRLGKSLRMPAQRVIEKYLRIDEDNDYVFSEMPCPFLGADNYCFVYDDRPKACRDFPHTNHTKMLKHINLALKNSSTCPAVYYVLERLAEEEIK